MCNATDTLKAKLEAINKDRQPKMKMSEFLQNMSAEDRHEIGLVCAATCATNSEKSCVTEAAAKKVQPV